MARADPVPPAKNSGPLFLSGNWTKRIAPRAVMITGFCSLLGLMVLLSIDSIHTLHGLQASSGNVRQQYLTREHTLRNIRFGLYESSNLLREYTLAESSSQTRDSYLAQLRSIRDRYNAKVESSLGASPPGQQDPFLKLSSELESYWRAVEDSMGDEAHEVDRAHLYRDILAQRATVLSITNEVSAVNELELRQSELEISKIFDRTRQRLRNFAILTIGIGLLLAISTFLYTSRLENRAEEKYRESLRYQSELKELSKNLDDAHEEERRAISRELHDQIAQTLTALLINVRDLLDRLKPSDPSENGLHKIQLLGEECLNKIRNTALLLRPSMLDDLGLAAALEWQAREVSRRTGLAVEVIDSDFRDDLPDEHKTCIFRIVQEALNNCAAHARASKVRVSLKEDLERCVLSIEDNGIGFDPTRKRGLGLLGMNERVARLGGTFSIESAPRKGTSIRVELPLTPIQESQEQAT